MKTYKIEIQEILSEIIEVEANSESEALENAELLYKNEEIVLCANNHIATDFVINKENIYMKDEKYDLINEVIEYLFNDEKKHFEEYEEEPKNHIYLKLLRLKELNQ